LALSKQAGRVEFMSHEDDRGGANLRWNTPFIPAHAHLVQGPIPKPKGLDISDERFARSVERIREARAAAYASDPHRVERLWYAYSRGLFYFMLKEHFRSSGLEVPPTGDSDPRLSDRSGKDEG